MIASAISALFLLGQAIPAISDAELATLANSPVDKSIENEGRVLGLRNGQPVLVTYFCSDVCPAYTVRVIHYDLPDGIKCETVGGRLVDMRIPRGVAMSSRTFCVPNFLAPEPLLEGSVRPLKGGR
jgi:hypothetical protein